MFLSYFSLRMIARRKTTAYMMLLAAFFSGHVLASNTGGVFGPVVNEGHKSFQYRGSYDPDSHALAQRVHYQQAYNDDFMWRGIAQFRKTDDQNVDYDFFQGELFWELGKINSSWTHGLRFDLRIRDGDRPNVFGVNWMNQFSLSSSTSARFLILMAKEFSSNARSGVFLQTRANVMHRVNKKLSANLELFTSYGSTSDLSLSKNNQQFGPSLVYKLNKDWQIYAGMLAGLNSRTPDQSYRFRLIRKL